MWLLIKEGIHIILDRILLKDNAHLSAKCPLYGRLSRAEKRAAVLNYASRMVLKKSLRRDVLVDTISMCVFEACEQEAVLEAPSLDLKKSKSRVPFMQKVMGEAMQELLGASANAEDEEVAAHLIKQTAGEAIIADAVDRMRDVWMSAQVTLFFDRVSESDKPSPLVYDVGVEDIVGVQYFLPEVPALTPAAERDLADAIRLDESDAGKETVFAANLKKALKLIRQSRRGPGGLGEDEEGHDDDLGSVITTGSAESASTAGSGAGSGGAEWWVDQSWILRHCQLPATEVAGRLLEAPAAWFGQWRSMSTAERREVMSLSAAETCDVIDHHPLWFSLRGMVGCNLLRDGMWPIISNDGHLSCVHFSKDSRSRFWYVPENMNISVLFPMFMAWGRTMSETLKFELRAMGWALGEGRLDEVSRGVQYQLENAVVSFVLFKIVAKCMQRHAAQAAAKMADMLLQEELEAAAAAEAKEGKKAAKKAKERARKAEARAKAEAKAKAEAEAKAKAEAEAAAAQAAAARDKAAAKLKAERLAAAQARAQARAARSAAKASSAQAQPVPGAGLPQEVTPVPPPTAEDASAGSSLSGGFPGDMGSTLGLGFGMSLSSLAGGMGDPSALGVSGSTSLLPGSDMAASASADAGAGLTAFHSGPESHDMAGLSAPSTATSRGLAHGGLGGLDMPWHLGLSLGLPSQPSRSRPASSASPSDFSGLGFGASMSSLSSLGMAPTSAYASDAPSLPGLPGLAAAPSDSGLGLPTSGSRGAAQASSQGM